MQFKIKYTLVALAIMSLLQCVFLTSRIEASQLSRLNQMLQNKSRLYLPSRLYVGTTNKLVIQGKPGAKVILFASPEAEGAAAPNGGPLRVGTNAQTFNSRISENGVSEIPLTLPEELEGKPLYLDAVVYSEADYSDMSRVELLNAASQHTENNQVQVTKVGAGGKGAFLMPTLPGLNPQVMQQIQASSEAQSSNDQHKKDLLYGSGERQGNTLLERNSFIKVPGQSSGITDTGQ